MFRWKVKVEREARASCRDIWEIWADVPSWPQWDEELEWSVLRGPFVEGAIGKLKPRGWRETEFHLTSLEAGRSFSDETRMPMTKVVFSHSLVAIDGAKVIIQHHAEAKGLLAPLLFFTLRRKLLKGLPLAVAKLARLAESKARERGSRNGSTV